MNIIKFQSTKVYTVQVPPITYWVHIEHFICTNEYANTIGAVYQKWNHATQQTFSLPESKSKVFLG